jgi:ribosomal protein L40E
MESIDAFLRTPLTRLGVSSNCIIAILVLIVIYFYPENAAVKTGGALAFLEYNKTDAIVYVIIVLIAAAYNVSRKPFLSPEVKHSICNFCGARMTTSELVCMKCKSQSTKNKN